MTEPPIWDNERSGARNCRVYWGHAGCRLPRGHEGGHVAESGSTPYPGLMFGEDTTEEERSEM